ncbi:MAG: DUF4263 domain-containing protein [Treponematales bacterium]
MTTEEIVSTWNKAQVVTGLDSAFKNNSERELLAILKDNSFLFYELYSRKYGIQPAFHEVDFGGKLRCDFAWLNDNSDGPEWTLVEIEKPRLNIFKNGGEPTQEFNHAIEQVKSWRRYFNENPAEKKRIFGAVSRFRYILVAGDKETWSTENAAKWRMDNNREEDIEIRSSDVFSRAIKILEKHPDELWSFAEHPKTLKPSTLQSYLRNENMDVWGQLLEDMEAIKKYMNEWRKVT